MTVKVTKTHELSDDDLETGSCTSMQHDDELEEEEERVNLADKETTAVFRLRLLVLLALLLAAVAVSVIVYFITSNAEMDEYKNQYAGAEKKVLESFLDIMDSKVGAVSAMGVAIIGELYIVIACVVTDERFTVLVCEPVECLFLLIHFFGSSRFLFSC